MRKAVFFVATLVFVSCMKKEPDGSYRVTNPITTDTAKARANAAKSGDELHKAVEQIGKSEAAQKIKAGSKELGRGVEQGIGHAAEVAGAKLQKAGKKVEDAARH